MKYWETVDINTPTCRDDLITIHVMGAFQTPQNVQYWDMSSIWVLDIRILPVQTFWGSHNGLKYVFFNKFIFSCSRRSEYHRRRNLDLIVNAIKRISDLNITVNKRDDIVIDDMHKVLLIQWPGVDFTNWFTPCPKLFALYAQLLRSFLLAPKFSPRGNR